MTHRFKAGTIELVADDVFLCAQETRDPKPAFDRIAGLTFAAVFFAAGGFFWIMPVANADEVFWLRVILCGGLAAIGLVLGWGAFGDKTSFEFVELDREQGLLISGHDTPKGRKVLNCMQVRAIENVYLGSEAQNSWTAKFGGTTALYVEGAGAPRKNVLLVGSGVALNEVKGHIQRLSTD
ncbi:MULTISPECIES: hypothetical protein [Thiorhodovibrio]|uniref:hypothetical protein n=1 Tax=Thiorhodovibrio TaxID=61593 RepID=UPI001911F051|nr:MULTISPECIES: hypothetical protein [Thiorhodovibrio]MBK5968391.1 hypothetical protein [Thiorhodovibrio winogradskyi]WPL13156.1 hypothetical protein Thiosp_02950 [Thiorhodovibrio litoralis]